jgi:hypothetical protein
MRLAKRQGTMAPHLLSVTWSKLLVVFLHKNEKVAGTGQWSCITLLEGCLKHCHPHQFPAIVAKLHPTHTSVCCFGGIIITKAASRRFFQAQTAGPASARTVAMSSSLRPSPNAMKVCSFDSFKKGNNKSAT